MSIPPLPPLTVREGRRVRLRHTRPSDYEFLYSIDTTGDRTISYRLRGATPGFERYVQSLFQETLAFLMVESKVDGRPLGSVAAYGCDHRDGHAKIAAIAAPTEPSGGPFIEAPGLLIDFLFAAYPLRKLYGEVLASNLRQFGSTPYREEGRLREHSWVNGCYEDMIIVALYRDDWNQGAARRAEWLERFRSAQAAVSDSTT
jgi:RimJ/RimL family protein N-acetyltransferase